MLSKHVCSSIEKNKVKDSNKTLCTVVQYICLRCQMPGHIMKRFCNLQVNFNRRPQYIRAKLSRCTRANHFESRSQTEKTTSPGLYKRATSFRYCTYVENWLYVCRHGGGSFLSARDSKWLVLMRCANFASVLSSL